MSKIILLGSKISLEEVYSVQVIVYTVDGRSDSKAVVIQRTERPVPELSISSVISKFNPGTQLILSSTIKYDGSVQAAWTASISGIKVDFMSLTGQSTNFSASQVSSFIQFPIVITGGNFVPGSTVSFRISAYALGAFSYSDITLQAYQLPTGGRLSVNPNSGYGLSTFFSFLCTNWIVDTDSLPLYYSFFYLTSSSSPPLYVSKKSVANSLSTQLPSGLASLNYALLISAFVYDNLDNSASANISVEVRVNSSAQSAAAVGQFWEKQLLSFEASVDTGALVSSMNAVSSTLNVVNCSQASAKTCALLNRDVCSNVPSTCSSCLNGFKGLNYHVLLTFFKKI